MKGKKILTMAVVIIVCFISFAGFQFYLKSRPKVTVVMATNFLDSGWFNYGQKAINYLEMHGVTLKNVETSGSRENFNLLIDPKSDVNAALIASGFIDKNETFAIRSLGAVGLEPIWIFYRSTLETPPKTLKDLANLSVLVSPKESGSYGLTKKLFGAMGINIDNNPNFSSNPVLNNIDNFLAGKGDVIILSAAYDDILTRKVFFAPNVSLYEVEPDANFYERTGLNVVILPSGAMDAVNNLPAQDTKMFATFSILAVKRDLQPQVQIALLLAARALHIEPPFLYTDFRAQLPAPIHFSEIKMSQPALKFYKDGPPFLNQYVPTWLSYFRFE
jgi:hypothetical protein